MSAATAHSLDDIRSTFAFFDDWQDKYRFLIDIGRGLDELPASDKREENLVRGCQSQVWLTSRFDARHDRVHLAIDSDAHIVRGLIAIVLAAYEGRSPREILDFDVQALFAELDLMNHLSPTRGNGLNAMVGRIRSIASDYAESAVQSSSG